MVANDGLFCSLHRDRGGHFFATRKAGEKVDQHRQTQVGRAMKELPTQIGRALQELQIVCIAVHSHRRRDEASAADAHRPLGPDHDLSLAPSCLEQRQMSSWQQTSIATRCANV